MDSGKMREEFEAWIRGKHAAVSLSICTHEEGFRFSVGEYKNEIVHASWIAWQASRESLVIELPSHLDHTSVKHAIEACAEAIESVGLKVAK